jgi:hypothetical protein
MAESAALLKINKPPMLILRNKSLLFRSKVTKWINTIDTAPGAALLLFFKMGDEMDAPYRTML